MGTIERAKSAEMKNYTFLSGSFRDSQVTVAAPNESSARRKAMVHLWGALPDKVVPHAPKYEGKGLLLQKIEPIGS